MSKEDLLEFDGTVTEVLPDGNFRVKLDNEHELLAYMSGKMRKFRIRTGVGDRVVIEVSPYDLNRGRINFRHKDTNRPMGSPPTRRQRRPEAPGDPGLSRDQGPAGIRQRTPGADLAFRQARLSDPRRHSDHVAGGSAAAGLTRLPMIV